MKPQTKAAHLVGTNCSSDVCHMSTASPNSLTAAPRQRVRQNSESLTHLSVMCSIYLHQIVVLHSVHLVHTAGCSRRLHATMELRLALDPATEMHCVPCGARIERELYLSTATNRFAANRLLQIACCKLLAANRLLQITCCDSLAFDYVPGYVSDFPYIEFSTQNPLFLFYLKLVRKVVWCNITGMHQRFSFYAPAVPVLIRCESSHSFRAGDGPRNGRRRPAAVIICAAPMICNGTELCSEARRTAEQQLYRCAWRVWSGSIVQPLFRA